MLCTLTCFRASAANASSYLSTTWAANLDCAWNMRISMPPLQGLTLPITSNGSSQSGCSTHRAVHMRCQGPVGEAQQPPHALDQDVDRHEDVVQHIPQEAGHRMRQVHCRVAPACKSTAVVLLPRSAISCRLSSSSQWRAVLVPLVSHACGKCVHCRKSGRAAPVAMHDQETPPVCSVMYRLHHHLDLPKRHQLIAVRAHRHWVAVGHPQSHDMPLPAEATPPGQEGAHSFIVVAGHIDDLACICLPQQHAVMTFPGSCDDTSLPFSCVWMPHHLQQLPQDGSMALWPVPACRSCRVRPPMASSDASWCLHGNGCMCRTIYF